MGRGPLPPRTWALRSPEVGQAARGARIELAQRRKLLLVQAPHCLAGSDRHRAPASGAVGITIKRIIKLSLIEPLWWPGTPLCLIFPEALGGR